MEPGRGAVGGGEGRLSKRPYQRPEIRPLGKVRELTLGGGSIQVTDSPGFTVTKAVTDPG
jgi:hypothetical protein